jgi:hypothetical protein
MSTLPRRKGIFICTSLITAISVYITLRHAKSLSSGGGHANLLRKDCLWPLSMRRFSVSEGQRIERFDPSPPVL